MIGKVIGFQPKLLHFSLKEKNIYSKQGKRNIYHNADLSVHSVKTDLMGLHQHQLLITLSLNNIH
jgi:hypothetical protein